MKYAFISYSHKNSKHVHKLKETLEKNGIAAWIDLRISGGDSITDECAQQLYDSSVFVCMMSKPYMESKYCMRELELAFKTEKLIIPIRLDKTKFSPRVDLLIGARKFIDFTKKYRYALEEADLISVLRSEGCNKDEGIPPFQDGQQKKIVQPVQFNIYQRWSLALSVVLSVLIIFYSVIQNYQIGKKSKRWIPVPHEIQQAQSLLILPFETVGNINDTVTSYGVTVGLWNRLTSVIRNEKILSYKLSYNLQRLNMQENRMAKNFGIKYFLSGAVSRKEDNLVVSVILRQKFPDSILWRKNYSEIAISNIEVGVYHEILKKVAEYFSQPIPEPPRMMQITVKAWDAYNHGLDFGRSPGSNDNLKSILCYEAAIQYDPTIVLAYCHLAGSQIYQYGFDHDKTWLHKAEQNLDEAYSLDSSRGEIYWHRGRLLENAGLYDSALALYFKARDLNPGLSEVYAYIGDYYLSKKQDTASAYSYFFTGYNVNPGDFFTLMNLGAINSSRNQFDESIKWLNQAQQLDSNNVDLLVNLSCAYEGNNFTDNAQRYIRKAFSIDPDGTLWEYIQFLIRHNDFTSVDSILNKRIIKDRNNYLYYYYRGYAKSFLKENDAAKIIWRTGLNVALRQSESNTSNMEALRFSGLFLSTLGDFSAIQIANTLLNKDSLDADNLITVAKIYSHLHDKLETAHWLKRANEKFPEKFSEQYFQNELEFFWYRSDPDMNALFAQ